MTEDPILIIGAGMAGLTAARLLEQAKRPVLVLDKGRGVGGRMATRRFGGGRFDHGAQFFSVRDERFRQWVIDWQAAGLVDVWGQGFAAYPGPSAGAGHPRYRGSAGMTAVPKYLASQLNVHLRTQVTTVSNEGNHWLAYTKSGERFRGQALLLTPPVPQSLALLAAGQVALPDDIRENLEMITYDSCLALMALFAGCSHLPEPGGLRFSEGPIAWMADNHQKGISPNGYAVTIHASPDYSRQHWQTDTTVIVQELLDVAGDWLHQDLIDCQLHRWRYSQPKSIYSEPMICLSGLPVLALAGDAFGGARVEGAAISGYMAVQALLSSVNT